jgi:gamma-glutamyltranspeptidase/glutathione hydrolase
MAHWRWETMRVHLEYAVAHARAFLAVKLSEECLPKGPDMLIRNRRIATHGLLRLVVILAMAFSPVSAQETATANTADQPAVGTAGMVSSAHPLATEAGLRILDAGGNAFDAAVAVAAMLNVVEPMMSGIGGYGTILVFDASKEETWFLNPSGRIPAAVDSDVYREPTPGYRENRRGAKAVSTPGNVNAWAAMWERYGRLDWSSLFAEAITTASDGFAINERTAGLIESAFPTFPKHAKEFYGRSGTPLGAGDLLVQRDLARSFRLIATYGAEVVHGGGLGLAIHEAMRDAGGFLTIDDLTANEAEWWDPIGISYRGLEVLTASPPANSFPALVRLGMMSMYDPIDLGHNTTEYLHTYAEVTKHGFWTRLRWAGDPEMFPPPLETLLSEDYWREEVAKIYPDRARSFEPPTAFSNGDSHTTHFVVADLWGNVVSATQTLGNSFGSRIMPEGTGIWLNNSLAYCTFEPKGNPMDAFPGRHKLSGDVPLFVMRNGKPWIVIGTPGGHTIGQTIPQIVMNAVDFGMDIQQAISAPRISFFEPDSLTVEGTTSARVRDELSALGHKIDVTRALGNAHGLTIEYDGAGRPIRFSGGADPRGQGSARGR